MERKKALDTRKLVLLAIFMAIVAVLQLLGSFIRFGPFSVSLVLMPIVVGAALMGVYAGGLLGLTFGFVVLLSGDAAPFLAVNPAATIFVVLLKGLLAGAAAGAAYKLIAGGENENGGAVQQKAADDEKPGINVLRKMFADRNKTIAVIFAAVACPVVNTGVFITGGYLFFLQTITQWGAGEGFATATAYIFLGMVSFNFLFELALNLVLSPVIVRLIHYWQARRIN